MQTQEIVVKNEVHNVILLSDSKMMEEVVVTAMGVRQEKKKLNFAVQSVGDDAISDSKSANFVNALQGKISGVSVTTGGGSPNSGQQIILRGISSINSSQGNEPLFVLDGMPLSGGANSMNKTLGYSLSFVAGLVIGGFAMKKYIDKKMKEAEELIECKDDENKEESNNDSDKDNTSERPVQRHHEKPYSREEVDEYKDLCNKYDVVKKDFQEEVDEMSMHDAKFDPANYEDVRQPTPGYEDEDEDGDDGEEDE